MAEVQHGHNMAPSTEDEIYRGVGTLAADAGLSPPLVLKSLKADLRATPHPRRALTNFHRFLMTGFSSAWLRDFQEHRLLQQILLELCAHSQFLADILVRNPELFRWLTTSTVLKVTKTVQQYASEASDAIRLFQRSEKKLDSLKRFQRRELLRIGARQVLREADVTTTSAELSALADSIIAAVLDMAFDQVGEAGEGEKRGELAVIALGKLGGEELNFSSDIDLMFVYDREGPLEGPHLRLTTLHEYYCRVAEYVVRRLSEHTAEGHLYRVDMRLRPDGNSGSLAMSRAAYMSYYEARGELWERQMLIKARVVAGDRRVGDEWKAALQPFIYPRTLITGPLEEIARIKAKIESNLAGEMNIKLGSGGIRDIEFAVQALQLINGGTQPQLQQQNTLLAIRGLVESGLLREREGRDLSSAYRFLRTIEDRLQLLHGLQKHSLPESGDERRILARQLGYGLAQSFVRDLELHRSKIRAVFRSVFHLKLGSAASKRMAAPAVALGSRSLRTSGLLNMAGAERLLEKLIREVPSLSSPDRLHSLLESARKHGSPDWCLDNFFLLASSAPIRRTFHHAVSSDNALELIVRLCSRSSKYVRLLLREPLLFEMLVGHPEELLEPGTGWTFLKGSDLPRYRTYNEFKSVLRFILNEISTRELTSEVSSLAEGILAETFDRARAEIRGSGEIPVALIALGKLGGKEMSVGSDLDVILFYRGAADPRSSKTVNDIGRKMLEILEGVYEVDFRLRPEGKNAPLATEIGYYREYLSNRASLWERQSLLKARFLGGDDKLGRESAQAMADFALQVPLPKGWKKDLLTMRRRMVTERSRKGEGVDLKVGIGGLADLEFLIQSLQLRYGVEEERLLRANTFEALAALGRHQFLNAGKVSKIGLNLEYLRRLETWIRINSEMTHFVLPSEKKHLQAIAAAMGTASLKTFRNTLQRVRKMNRRFYTATMRSLPA